MIKISDDFGAVDFFKWQELAFKSLKLENYEELEKKLNHKTCEGITLKSFYDRDIQNIHLATFPKTRKLIKYISSEYHDDSFDKFYSYNKVSGAKNITTNLNGPDEYLDLLKLFEELNFDLELLKEKISKMNCQHVLVKLSLIHNAGASMVQELAFSIAALGFLANSLKDSNIYFEVSVDSLYFCNISKLRALRFISESLNAQLNYPKIKIIAVPSKREQTLYDPWVNMLRETTTIAAAFIGGADEIAVENFDQLLTDLTEKTPNEVGTRQARNIFHILNEESFLQRVSDPSEGSYTIEALTQELITNAIELTKSYGKEGILSQIKKFSHQVELIALERKLRVAKLKHVIAGVNNFANTEDQVGLIKKDQLGLFPLRRIAEDFEDLRQKLEDKKIGIKVFVFGEESKLSARIMFCTNYFEVLGHNAEVVFINENDSLNYTDINIFCALDEDYEKILSKLKPQGDCFIAGAKFSKDGFQNIFQGQNRFELLSEAVKGYLS